MRQTFASALACHLDQTQGGKPVYRDAGVIQSEHLFEFFEYRVAMFGIVHIDEVTDDDTAQITQAQLARDDLCRFELVLKIVSSKVRPPTKPPVLTSIVVSASV